MTDAARAARREYKRKWAKDHPDRVRKHQEDFWERQARKGGAADGKNKNSAPPASGT